MTIQYIGVPADVKRQVQEILRSYKCVLPTWLEQLTFVYELKVDPDSELAGAIAAVSVSDEYRHMTIKVFGDQWGRPDVDHERIIVHEIAHGLVAPIEIFALSLLDAFGAAGENDPRDPLLDAMYEQRRRAMEMAVEDTARALIRARRA